MRRPISALLTALALAGLILVGSSSARADAPARALRLSAESWSLASAACPEPNDDLQRACAVETGSDALGFISSAHDVDTYRFEVLDADASVRLTLSDLPTPYRALVLDWHGDVVAASERTDDRTEVTQTVLHTPGSYFVAVSSRTGELTEAQPYRLGLAVEYSRNPPRRLVFGDDYAMGVADWEYLDDTAAISRGRGVLSIVPAVSGFPSFGMWPLAYGPADLTVIGDVRVTAGTNVDVHLNFGSTYDGRTSFVFLMNTHTGRLALLHHGDTSTSLVDLPRSPAIDLDGGVNRVVLEVAGDTIRAAVNSQDVLMAAGQSVESGRLSVSAASWGAPTTLTFDNLVVTAPSGPMPMAGTVLLSESFDNPGHQAISTLSTHPESCDFAYLDGEYRVRLLGGLESASMRLP